MRFTIFTTALMATLAVAHSPPLGFKVNVFDLAARDGGTVASKGTSPGCGAYCPLCGREQCACGSGGSDGKPCCNGYRSSGKNLANCAFPSITGNPNTKRSVPEPTKRV